jgi:hypothetical protein
MSLPELFYSVDYVYPVRNTDSKYALALLEHMCYNCGDDTFSQRLLAHLGHACFLSQALLSESEFPVIFPCYFKYQA